MLISNSLLFAINCYDDSRAIIAYDTPFILCVGSLLHSIVASSSILFIIMSAGQGSPSPLPPPPAAAAAAAATAATAQLPEGISKWL